MCKPGDQLQDPKTFMSHVFMNFWLTCCLSMKLPLKVETVHFFLIKKTFKFSRGWNFPYGICRGKQNENRNMLRGLRLVRSLPLCILHFLLCQCRNPPVQEEDARTVYLCQSLSGIYNRWSSLPTCHGRSEKQMNTNLLTSIIFFHPAYSYPLMKTVPVRPEDWSALKSSQSTLQHHAVHTLSAEMFNKISQL